MRMKSLLRMGMMRPGIAAMILLAAVVAPISPVAAESRNALELPSPVSGARSTVVLFARFADESDNPVPSWATDLFNPDLPGSFSHYYDTMSFGALSVRGDVAPRRYAARGPISDYLATQTDTSGGYARFALEILATADADIDFSRYDNDGPDRMPNSGDDDGVVDLVFINPLSIPSTFLFAEATGIASLGFEDPFVTDDVGAAGDPILISPEQGAIERSRTFTETVGSMCHEYGHILGLIDLYNTDFLQMQDGLPEEDSAGIGSWGLMGHGALGWRGDDGPVSLSAFSRMHLGWCRLTELGQGDQQIRLGSVGSAGDVFRVPMMGRESFLLEYRTRDEHYDRNIPGEGLLIWHVRWQPPSEGIGYQIDLECADGRWQDAGYPIGERADAVRGGDNLDFWAHDHAYAAAHAGNLGDADDPFDGVHYDAFTPETNPSSHSDDGSLSVRIEEISVDGHQVTARVQTTPLLIEVNALDLQDRDGDSLVVAYEPVRVVPQLVNVGGIRARDLRVRLYTADPHVELTQPESSFGNLGIGRQTFQAGTLELRFADTFVGSHQATVSLHIYANESLVGTHDFSITGVSPRQRIRDVVVIDSLGNGDRKLQVGEFFRLHLQLDAALPEPLAPFRFYLTPLNSALTVGGDQLQPGAGELLHSQEYLVSSDPEEQMHLEMRATSPYGTWRDTLVLPITPGIDATPPRFGLLRVRSVGFIAHLALPEHQVLDGSPIRAVRAHIYTHPDMDPLEVLDLAWKENRYEGTWAADRAGTFAVTISGTDAHGNTGHSAPQPFHIQGNAREYTGTDSPVRTGRWEPMPLPGSELIQPLAHLTIAPTNPSVLYAWGDQGYGSRAETGTWRSDDGGSTWTRLGLMVSRELLVDAGNSFKVYLPGNAPLASVDGGVSWEHFPDPEVRLLAVDPTIPDRIYGQRGTPSQLAVSDDAGASWRSLGTTTAGELRVHPGSSMILVAGRPSYWTPDTHLQVADTLMRSADGGGTWKPLALPKQFDDLYLDPHRLQGLYGVADREIWFSADGGNTWQLLSDVPSDGSARIAIHPAVPDLLYASSSWRENRAWRSEDGGRNWLQLDLPLYWYLGNLTPHPTDADGVYAVASAWGDTIAVVRSDDRGQTWKALPAPRATGQTLTLTTDAHGTIYVGATRMAEERGMGSMGYYTTRDGGASWRWQGRTIDNFDAKYPRTASRILVDPILPAVILWSDNRLWRTGDSGETWESSSPGASYYNDNIDLASDSGQPGVYYYATSEFFRSIDYGKSWIARSDGLPQYTTETAQVRTRSLNGLGVDSENGRIYVAVRDSVYRSRNAGESWEWAGRAGNEGSYITLAVRPHSGGELFAAGYTSVYSSTDEGATWRLRLQTEAVAIYRRPLVRFAPGDPDRLLYVSGTQLHVSRDGGNAWRSIGNDLTDVPLFYDAAVDPFEPEIVYAVTPWGLFRLDLRELPTAVIHQAAIPSIFTLHPNYPNPFNAQTTIEFSLPAAGHVHLALYDILGQRVRTLIDGRRLSGLHRIVWDGLNDGGRTAGSGVYFCRLKAGNREATRRMLLLK